LGGGGGADSIRFSLNERISSRTLRDRSAESLFTRSLHLQHANLTNLTTFHSRKFNLFENLNLYLFANRLKQSGLQLGPNFK